MKYEIGPFSKPILGRWCYYVESKLQNFERNIHKQIIHPKVRSSFDVVKRNTNLDIRESFLGWLRHHGELKREIFEIVTLNSNFRFMLTSIFLSYIAFWPNFGLMTSPRESKPQYFKKVISETNSSFQSCIKYWFWSFYRPRYMI